MTPERWSEIQRQLEVALSLTIAERRTFLESIGAKDNQLRDELESLLAGETDDQQMAPDVAPENRVSDWHRYSTVHQRVPSKASAHCADVLLK